MSLITYLTTTRFEFGAVKGLPDDLKALGVARPLIVTDRGIVASGLIERLIAVLPDGARTPLYDGTPTNPTEEAARAALAIYREHGCDGVIGFGGGSPIDLGKCVALMATHEPRLQPYAFIDGGVEKITAKVAPIVAVPTTAGTGAEVGRAALVTLDDGRKVAVLSPHMMPKRAVCDPELTLRLPAWLTAATGMDAMSHCIETYLSPRINPPAEAIALDGAGRIARAIERAVATPTDRDARWQMMMGSLEGGLTFQKGLGAVHALSHALGSLKTPSLHHGTLNAVLLPPVLRFNAGHVGDKYKALALAMGLDAGTDLAGHFDALNARLGMPKNLGAMGVTAAMIPEMSEKALRDHSTASNPRPASREDYAELMRGSL